MELFAAINRWWVLELKKREDTLKAAEDLIFSVRGGCIVIQFGLVTICMCGEQRCVIFVYGSAKIEHKLKDMVIAWVWVHLEMFTQLCLACFMNKIVSVELSMAFVISAWRDQVKYLIAVTLLDVYLPHFLYLGI